MKLNAKKINLYQILLRISNLTRITRVGIFLAVVLPVFLLATFYYFRTKKDLNDYTFSRRHTIAQFAAVALADKLDQLKDLGTSLATRVRFRELVNKGQWTEAIKLMSEVPKNFPIIDRIFLSDIDGTMKADLPKNPILRGDNFKYRDWYRGVTKEWKPYISDVYKRIAEPRKNVIAISVPIKNDNLKIIGILVLQVISDQPFDSIKGIEFGSEGYIYFVDRKGNIAYHPKYSAQDDIPNYISVPVVQKVLRGKKGVEVSFNPIEKIEAISAYEPVHGYGWGVIAQQPTATAFALQFSNLKGLLYVNGTIFIVTCMLAFMIVWIISLIKKAEEKVLKSQAFVDSVIENIPDMIVVKDIKELKYLRLNKAGEDLLGYSRNELVGKSDYDFFPKTEADFFTAKDRDVLLNGKKVEVPEETIHTRLKGNRILYTKKIPIFDNYNKMEYLLIISEDITEKKAAEQISLNLIKEQAARSEAEHGITLRDDFIAIASHELKTPITALKLQLQMIMRSLSRNTTLDKMQKSLGLSLKSVDHLTDLIDVLLDMTLIQRGNFQLSKEEINLSEIVMNVCTRLQVQLLEAGGAPQFALDTNITGFWDKVRLDQIISNILINAIKYAPGKPLKISVSGNEKLAFLVIQDFGGGISLGKQKKMFERFERGVSPRHISGFGLGLFIAEQLAIAHGGKISLKSEEGAGSTFTIELPR